MFPYNFTYVFQKIVLKGLTILHFSIFFFFKVGSYDTYLRYWSVLTPQVITFDPEGVRA